MCSPKIQEPSLVVINDTSLTFWSDTLAIRKQNVCTHEIDQRIHAIAENGLPWPTMGETYLAWGQPCWTCWVTPYNRSRLNGRATSGLEGRVPQLQSRSSKSLLFSFVWDTFHAISVNFLTVQTHEEEHQRNETQLRP